MRLSLLVAAPALAIGAAVPASAQDAAASASGGVDDAVVIAVVDGSFNPYHWDFLGSQMPQHRDADAANDLPLDTDPATWLAGHTGAAGLASYDALPVTLASDPDEPVARLLAGDRALFDTVPRSTGADAVHLRWLPGTKIIGMANFGGGRWEYNNGAHGANTSSVSAGNYHGTCPECLVVLVTYGGGDGEAANDWAHSQPWIDVVTNSWGYSLLLRDRFYSGANTELQREASERGQTIMFSSGNGLVGDFSVPNTTWFSSQEGPDWIVTVGATHSSGGQYTGAGKPADLASLGCCYPSLGGSTVTSSDRSFGGTSNATPVVAGYYARALWEARAVLDGASRVQADGVIAQGAPLACGSKRPDCELADGVLTAAELRSRLFEGAIPTPQSATVGTRLGDFYQTAPTGPQEYDLLAEGHGTYWGRLNGDEQWAAERERIFGPLTGAAALTARPAGEREWMIVDSYCRQSIWGTWSGGYWSDGEPLPAPAPTYPLRNALAAGCGELFPPVR